MKIVTIGEIMLRLTPPGFQRFTQANSFEAVYGGPAFIKAVMAPCPWHRLMPTGGVDAPEASVSF